MSTVSTAVTSGSARPASRRRLSLARREELVGYLLISPWLIGLLLFELVPILASLALSFTRYAVVDTPVWIGLDNYRRAFVTDALVKKSFWNTIYYVGFGVPLRIGFSFLLALLLNAKIRGILSFRVIYYVPTIIPAVGAAVLWYLMLNPRTGLVNLGLTAIGLPSINWLGDPQWSKPAFIMMSLWTLGGSMIIFLGGLQGIPTQLYDAAHIDGANVWQRFRSVTLPLMTPVIFLTLVMNVISSFQVFSAAFIMTRGGPRDSTLFYMLYLYDNAFQFFKMGYATALAWLLFVAIAVVTVVIVRSSDKWLFYQGGR